MISVKNFLILYPLITAIYFSIYYILSGNIFSLFYVILGFLPAEIINYVLKTIWPINWEFTRRPRNMPKTGCNFFPDYNLKLDKNNWPSGMPSGHAQLSFLFATYWSLYLKNKYLSSNNNNQRPINKYTRYLIYFTQILLYIIAFAVSYHRIHIHCHTWLQVICGGILGILQGGFTYYLAKYLIN